MSHPLLEKHRATLEGALHAIATRGYWSAHNEMPSPKAYGETAPDDGKRAFEAHLGQPFELGQPGQSGWQGGEKSPYGIEIGTTYPVCDIAALIAAGEKAMPGWQKIGADGRTGICLEILDRLNRQSFELAHAVMMTTGQGWMMAFQAGAPHAQERGLEAVTYAYREQHFVPHQATREKPQGKNPPLVLKKHFEIVGRGVGVVVGCGTFPTWNTYPGLFAVLAENGIAPDLVTLAVADHETTRKLVTHPAVKSVDFTGGNAFGRWLLGHCRQAQVYAELAGVNNIVIDSTDAYQRMLGNLPFTLALYSGQMCTTSQAILVPAGGIASDEGHKLFEDVCADLARAVTGFLSKPEVAHAVLGAIQSAATLRRIEEAAVALSERIVATRGALIAGIYSTRPEVIEAMTAATWRSKVALSINLTGGVFVNQSAACSDFHGTGGQRFLRRFGLRRQPLPRRPAAGIMSNPTHRRGAEDAEESRENGKNRPFLRIFALSARLRRKPALRHHEL